MYVLYDIIVYMIMLYSYVSGHSLCVQFMHTMSRSYQFTTLHTYYVVT